MKKVLAIAGLTWKSAFRYRLFWIMAVLLIAAVVGKLGGCYVGARITGQSPREAGCLAALRAHVEH